MTSLADIVEGRARWSVEPCDLRFALQGFPDCCVDAVVCDPPYELNFMSRSWDRTGIAFDPATWAECLRVAKPGAHLLAFGGTRTWHRIAVAIEDAGWTVRDSIAWLYASGFPKSLDVSKAIDGALGADREPDQYTGPNHKNGVYGNGMGGGITLAKADPVTAAAAAAGYGTAMKPAFEPVIVARKPLDGTVAANFMRHGTGGLNIDGCRIEGVGPSGLHPYTRSTTPPGYELGMAKAGRAVTYEDHPLGRWPANVCLDEHAAAILDTQSGDRPGMSGGGIHRPDYAGGMFGSIDCASNARNDNGGASRFFFCAKASTAEREMGLEHLPPKTAGQLTDRKEGSAGLTPRAGAGRSSTGRRNSHPTVKPVDLMRWLVRLVTPRNGLVLDPFTGSGTTGIATMLEGDGRRFVGLELDPYHVEIARARIAHVIGGGYERAVETKEAPQSRQVSLFGVGT